MSKGFNEFIEYLQRLMLAWFISQILKMAERDYKNLLKETERSITLPNTPYCAEDDRALQLKRHIEDATAELAWIEAHKNDEKKGG